jgi:hypothetical protein
MGYRFFAARVRVVLRELFREDFRDGTFAPFSRASLSPMAIACLRLVTFRPEPLFSVPFFLRRIVDSTFLDADFPYFAICTSGLSPANHVLKSATYAAVEEHVLCRWLLIVVGESQPPRVKLTATSSGSRA